jgi:hypothetical protein
MKKLIILLLAFALIGCQKGAVMAVDFNSSSAKVTFPVSIEIPAEMSISLWYYADTDGPGNLNTILSMYPDDNSPTVSISYGKNAQTGLNFQYAYSALLEDLYSWRYSTATLAAWHHLVITYDNTSADNDPVFYVDGAAVELTQDYTGTETSPADTFTTLYFGNGFDGKIEDPRIYNRILSQEEITELYQSRIVRSVPNGLVFHPVFCGAAGLSRFDGVTLGAANTICDNISGAVGVPVGNPIGRGNTIQRIY